MDEFMKEAFEGIGLRAVGPFGAVIVKDNKVIPLIYYGATQDDAKDIGFDDSYIYEVLQNKHSNEKMKICQVDRELCLEPFRKYEEDEERTLY